MKKFNNKYIKNLDKITGELNSKDKFLSSFRKCNK